MKKTYIIAGIFGTALLLGTPLCSRTVQAQQTSYIDENGTEKTIYWTDHITPPTMNGPNDTGSDFKKLEQTISGVTYVDYIAPYGSGSGWYDVNKTQDQVLDKNLCFSAAASNMLHWWFDQNQEYVDRYLQLHPEHPRAAEIRELQTSPTGQHDSKIYEHFMKQFANRQTGFWPDLLQDQFLNGYTPKESGGVTDPDYEGPELLEKGPDQRGGFFYHVFGPDILTRRRYYDYVGSYPALSKDLKEFITQGDMVTLTYDMGASAHVVTLWGVEYDPSGNLCGVYFSDSDDLDEAGMHRYRIVSRQEYPYLTTDIRDDGSGSKVTCITTLSSGRTVWEKAAQDKTELKLLWGNTEFIYNGTVQGPEVSCWGIVEGEDVVLSSDGKQTEAGTYTVSAKLDGTAADRYALPADSEKSFTIAQSGTAFLGDLRICCGTEETTSFVPGDTISVKAVPRATGVRPGVSGEPIPDAVPVNGQMSLYSGGQLLAGPVSPDGNGSYTLDYTITGDNLKPGANMLAVTFQGDGNMADCEQNITVTLICNGYLPVAEVPPTCETPGRKAHFKDENGKLYIEENGIKKEVTAQELELPATGHRPGIWMQEQDRHFQECLNGCGSRLNEAACSGGEATLSKQAVCKICGKPYGKKLEKYEILSGSGSIYQDSSGGQLVFRANGSFTDFTAIKVDGTFVDGRHYAASSGSTVITLCTEYLRTLSEGSHTLEILYKDGTVSCSFKIVKDLENDGDSSESNPSGSSDRNGGSGNSGTSSHKTSMEDSGSAEIHAVKTGDDSPSLVWGALLALSLCAILIGWKLYKRK